MKTLTPITAAELKQRLELLESERALAGLNGLAENQLYATDLEDEAAVIRAAYIGAAVTEIATLRAEISGPLHG